ncbi:MAG: single-stranded DNA-binding protein [Pseudobdellovibrionaceae bacterium]
MTRHDLVVIGVCDIVDPVEVKSVGTRSSRVGATRVAFVTQNQEGLQKRQFYTLEAWNGECDKLAKLQIGTTIMFKGTFTNEKYSSNGQDRYRTKINAYSIGYVGKTSFVYDSENKQKKNHPEDDGQPPDYRDYPGFSN